MYDDMVNSSLEHPLSLSGEKVCLWSVNWELQIEYFTHPDLDRQGRAVMKGFRQTPAVQLPREIRRLGV